MANNFNFSPNNNTGFNFSQKQSGQIQKFGLQKQQKATQNQSSKINPFSVDDLFKFKRENILYNRVMKSTEMVDFLKAQKIANKFMNLTEPEHEVGKRLNLDI